MTLGFSLLPVPGVLGACIACCAVPACPGSRWAAAVTPHGGLSTICAGYAGDHVSLQQCQTLFATSGCRRAHLHKLPAAPGGHRRNIRRALHLPAGIRRCARGRRLWRPRLRLRLRAVTFASHGERLPRQTPFRSKAAFAGLGVPSRSCASRKGTNRTKNPVAGPQQGRHAANDQSWKMNAVHDE